MIYNIGEMKLHLGNPDENHLIKSCEKHGEGYQIRIGDTLYTSSLIITSEKLELWPVHQVSDLATEDFSRLAEFGSEVVLLGTRSRLVFPHPRLTRPLIELGIGLEVMDTPAACRTWNILLSDGRNAAIGLIL